MNDWKYLDSRQVEVKDSTFTLQKGETVKYTGRHSSKGFKNFEISGFVQLLNEGSANLMFHTDKTGKGYEVIFHNGAADGTLKSGSLSGIRNLYKSMGYDSQWLSFVLTVIDKSISIYINGVEVVNYTEPDNPYRTDKFKNRILGKGNFTLSCSEGQVSFKDLFVKSLPQDLKAPEGSSVAIDEQNDRIIKLQQEFFPVIDYHVHLKGWTKEEAHAKSMNYGINYGIAPNCGIGFPITNDAGVAAYVDSTRNMPFFFGMQGEGREWVDTFSVNSRNMFDYVFTDALTFTDHKGRRTRLWIDDEVFIDIPQEKYMDQIVDKTVQILNNEPIDIYVNPCFLPSAMEKDYDKLWTKPRIQKVVDALKKNNIALEINARYRIPNFEIIKAAKDAGIKFTFGTNNADPDLGKLEYCMEAIDACGITVDDMWFPTDKTIRK